MTVLEWLLPSFFFILEAELLSQFSQSSQKIKAVVFASVRVYMPCMSYYSMFTADWNFKWKEVNLHAAERATAFGLR